jgi:hypothetical protein
LREKEEKLKGDKLRELLLLVYLNNKYDRDKNKLPWLKEKLGYSTGGLYSALDNSGYFERKNDDINLTQKGTDYLKRHLLPQFTAFNPIGTFLIILGFVFLWQWYFWTFMNTYIVIPWYSGVVTVATGLVIRLFFMRLGYWIIRSRKQEK